MTRSLVHVLLELLRGRRVVALTGAGMSTGSGIPDYRGPETRKRARSPIQYREFIKHADARRRYWARSSVGWLRIAAARPNPAHTALAALERAGVVRGVITQNVDGLHHAAGSRRIIELHGSLREVTCMSCGFIESRVRLQERLAALNPGWERAATDIAPDGDAELGTDAVAAFRVAACTLCDGVLKPHVVFFGENVPRERVDASMALLGDADVLLVAGSSLTVFSGYRFVREAARRGMRIAIVNLGPTRGDEHAHVRIDADVADILPALADALS